MTARLFSLVRARGGVITGADADRLGLDAIALSRLTREGHLTRVRPGAYAAAADWAGASDVERYAMRTRAVLRTRPELVASHQAALVLAGVVVPRMDLEVVHAVDIGAARTRARRRDGLSVHPSPQGCDIARDDHGDRMLEPATALVQVGVDQGELAFAVCLDRALSTRATSTEQVADVLDAQRRCRRRAGRLRQLLESADPLSPGPEATRLRIVVASLGFRPRLRVPIRGRDGGLLARPELLVGTSIAVVRTAYPPGVVDRLHQVGIAVAVVDDQDVGHPERVARAVAGAMREVAVMQRERARGA